VAGKKQFDPQEALAVAVQLFRANGYASTSIDDLVTLTGVGRGSLYSTFGNKERLFLSTLDLYCADMMACLVVDTSLPPRLAIRGFLVDLLDTIETWGRGGCLVTNTCAEYAGVPRSAQRRVTRALVEQRRQLAAYFDLAASRGELMGSRTPTELADLFVALRQSLCLLWKAGERKRQLVALVDTALDSLEATALGST
jgi:TetR/AcrR family transcriptional repressor of nem operon